MAPFSFHIFNSLKGKLILSVCLSLILVVGLSTFYISQRIKSNLRDSAEDDAIFFSNVILTRITEAMHDKKTEDLQEILTAITSSDYVDEIWLFDEKGKVVHETGVSDHNQLTVMDEIEKNDDCSFVFSDKESQSHMSLVKIHNDKSCMGCHDNHSAILGYLAVKMPVDKVRNNLAFLRRLQIVNAVILIFVISGLIVFFVSIFIDRPLKELTGKMAQLREGDQSVRIPIKHVDELDDLARGFNTMVDRLKESDKKVRALHHEQLKRADRLANLGEMAAGVAHEINNPAGIILTRIGYLLHRARNERFSKSVIEDLKAIETLTIRISEIVKGLLDYSKATTSLPHDFCLNDVVGKLLSILEPKMIEKRIRLYKHLDSGYSTIHADRSQIEQVVLNIVNNAIDSMSSGGNLIVKTESVRRNARNGFVLLSVRDSGIGIPAENLKKIFTPFFTTKEEGKGTGLGLAISDGIVKTHGGMIDVNSSPGKGAEFRIYFPLSTSRKS